MLRMLYSRIKDRSAWRIENNDKFLVLYRKIKYFNTDKSKKTGMAGNFVRMADDRTVKKVLLGKPDGRREAGKPKLRWINCIVKYLKSMGVKRWKKQAQGRAAWAIILKEAVVELKDFTPVSLCL
jgi:hypothetical protein